MRPSYRRVTPNLVTEIARLMFSLISLSFAAFFLLVGVSGGMLSLRRRWLIKATPTSRVREAPGGALVEIKGTVRAGEELVIAPLSGRPAVWFRAHVAESLGKSSRTLFAQTLSRPFFLDDGSGELARILPDGASFELMIGGRRTLRGTGITPTVMELLGRSASPEVRSPQAVTYEESALSPGDELYVLGPSRREPGPAIPSPYRSNAATQLVVSRDPTSAQELLFSDQTEERLVSTLGKWIVVSAVVTGLGLFFAALAILVER
jgi:E3 Ubiquitin ligase